MSIPSGPIPVLEQIRQNVLQTIGKITPLAGYTFTAIPTEPERLGEETGDGVVIVQLGHAQQNTEIQSNQLVEWMQEFLFTIYVVQNETNEASWDQLIACRAADVHKALQVDYTRGNWAHDTLPEAPDWFQRSDGEHEGVTARCYVRYRTDYGNPYNAR